jgi:hypothetical protein
VAFAGTAFAGAIDKLATARPATKGDTAFMAISSRFSGQLCHLGAYAREGG